MKIIRDRPKSVDLHEFFSRPLFGFFATASESAPRVSPVWFLWEDDAIWVIGNRKTDTFPSRVESEPRCAIAFVDFDPSNGRVHHVGMRGRATVEAWDEQRAKRVLRRYLGTNEEHWSHERFIEPLDDPDNVLVRFTPETAVARDQSYRAPPLERPESATRMESAEVREILERLEAAGVTVWVDGGWGVDALVGEETRTHADLDLAIRREELGRAQAVIERLGFEHDPTVEPGLPARLVLRNRHSGQVDLHPLVFDEAGNGWQQLSETGRAWGRYPAEHLQAAGVIGGRRVRCLSAELQLRFRLTHKWTARDEHDLRLLTERFDVGPVPPPFWPERH